MELRTVYRSTLEGDLEERRVSAEKGVNKLSNPDIMILPLCYIQLSQYHCSTTSTGIKFKENLVGIPVITIEINAGSAYVKFAVRFFIWVSKLISPVDWR